jgi:hypothetical protein
VPPHLKIIYGRHLFKADIASVVSYSRFLFSVMRNGFDAYGEADLDATELETKYAVTH